LTFTNGACTPKGDCDFEDKNGCGYENDLTNDVDWLVYSGSTPSYNTGPTMDHTTGLTTGNSFQLCNFLFLDTYSCFQEICPT